MPGLGIVLTGYGNLRPCALTKILLRSDDKGKQSEGWFGRPFVETHEFLMRCLESLNHSRGCWFNVASRLPGCGTKGPNMPKLNLTSRIYMQLGVLQCNTNISDHVIGVAMATAVAAVHGKVRDWPAVW